MGNLPSTSGNEAPMHSLGTASKSTLCPSISTPAITHLTSRPEKLQATKPFYTIHINTTTKMSSSQDNNNNITTRTILPTFAAPFAVKFTIPKGKAHLPPTTIKEEEEDDDLSLGGRPLSPFIKKEPGLEDPSHQMPPPPPAGPSAVEIVDEVLRLQKEVLSAGGNGTREVPWLWGSFGKIPGGSAGASAGGKKVLSGRVGRKKRGEEMWRVLGERRKAMGVAIESVLGREDNPARRYLDMVPSGWRVDGDAREVERDDEMEEEE
ncbi:hypothetical protein EJ08DRAFT_467691 [Tothia fuscella]|uniref:Uncharacterized protein n=1 Tax=Tothia fuscella TaxID=1048955 RepID=A0A9P4P0I5_9PEZI|nr:hypothetical protein EJ08DRAFT_467691 [Tothia fuscella]